MVSLRPTGLRRPSPNRRGRTALLLVSLLVAALLVAACSGGDDSSPGDSASGGGSPADAAQCPLKDAGTASAPVEVKLWHAYFGVTKTTLEQLAARFNASQNRIRVSVEAQGTYEELLKKFQDALGDPKTLPDLILTEDTTLQFMIDSGAVVPASACIAADPPTKATYDGILPAVTAAYTVDGTLWPGAFSVSTPVMYVNKAILQAAQVDTTKLPTTLDELEATARKIKAANIPGVTEPLVMKMDSWYIENWLTGDRKAVVDQDNGRAGLAKRSEFDSRTTKKLFDWMKRMVDDGLLKPVSSSANGIDEYLALNAKSSAMLLQTSTAISTVQAILQGSVKPGDLGEIGADQQVSTGLDITVAAAPGMTGAGEGQIAGSGWYTIRTGRPGGVGGAWQFLQFFLQVPNQVDWTLNGSYLPVLKTAAEDPGLQKEFTSTTKGQWLATAYQGLTNLDPKFPGPVIGPYNEFRAAARTALDGVTLSGQPTGPAIRTANETFQNALTAYAKDISG